VEECAGGQGKAGRGAAGEGRTAGEERVFSAVTNKAGGGVEEFSLIDYDELFGTSDCKIVIEALSAVIENVLRVRWFVYRG
jgi:hypothetical protein